jgi:hypothetical protein
MKPTNVDLLKQAADYLDAAADLLRQAAKPRKPRPTR